MTSYTDNAREIFRQYKSLADKAISQIPDQALFNTPGGDNNSIAVVIKHIAGNMRSRWTDFLNTDGEKPDRLRDTEFELTAQDTHDSLLQYWEAGWAILFQALQPLSDADLQRTVFIRHQPHTVMQAINRQIAHYAYHVGQIVYLAKMYAADQWQSLSVPKGKSEEYNAGLMKS